MPNDTSHLRDLLRLTMTPGLGPTLIGRLLERFGSAAAALEASETGLREVRGIGEGKAVMIARGLRESERLADEELALADELGVSIIARGEEGYPPLLAQTPDAPPLLYVRGELRTRGEDRYTVAIVGSRSCTAYGHEQAARFAMHLAGCGLTVVSGGARGIDSSAHHAALRAGPHARTIAVLGCGLANVYPPDNKGLFDRIAEGSGAVLSELPLRTAPSAENFTARNRIISGMSLGVVLIEAGRRSGALITARYAAEDHGREVFALPARVDSPAAEGSLGLLKSGAAALVTHPEDVIEALEAPARHLHQGTHAARYGGGGLWRESRDREEEGEGTADSPAGEQSTRVDGLNSLTDAQRATLAALEGPLTLDELSRETGLDPAALRSEVTVLEIRRRVRREGIRLARVRESRT